MLSVLLAGAASYGCGGSSPIAPPPVSSSITVRVVDGLTNAPIAGVAVSAGDVSGTTNDTGHVTLTGTGLNSGSTIFVSGANGYRARRTLSCGRDVTLWPNRPGDVDDAITQALGYNSSGRMDYPGSVSLLPSAELLADDGVMATLRDAASHVMSVIEGKTAIAVGGSGVMKYDIRINPAIPTTGQTTRSATGGVIEFRDMKSARMKSLAMHEIVWTLGAGAPSPYPGLMSKNISGTDFTEQEKRVLLLRYTRPVGALFTGDDDTSIPCASR